MIMRVRQTGLSLCVVGILLALAGAPAQTSPRATLAATMSNPACVQVAANSGACAIIIRSVSASASDQTFTHLDIVIDGKVRARIQTFFEATAYLGNRMLGQGLLVACGRPNDSGDPNYGHRYQVTYNGYLAGSDIPAATGTASVYCPYYEKEVYLPLVQKSTPR
jgi:hypothetical protein